MVVIRLSRGGAKKRPFYHLVVADKRCRRDGRYIERVGYFNPIARGPEIRLHMNIERIKHWLTTGAKPSERVAKLISDYEAAGGNIASGVESVATAKVEVPKKAAKKPAAKKEASAEEAAPAEKE